MIVRSLDSMPTNQQVDISVWNQNIMNRSHKFWGEGTNTFRPWSIEILSGYFHSSFRTLIQSEDVSVCSVMGFFIHSALSKLSCTFVGHQPLLYKTILWCTCKLLYQFMSLLPYIKWHVQASHLLARKGQGAILKTNVQTNARQFSIE